MKDEELKGFPIEEQIDFVIDLKRKITLEKGFCTDADIYLAGLKAGRPQWHKVKDENDFPKEHIPVLVILESGVPDVSFVSTDKRWFCTNYYTGEDKVIAWCEIPTFDKE